jgi:hypothetical protein
MEIGQLKQLLIQSWNLETCSPGLRDKWNEENPSIGQCAITALIVNDFFGGKIMRCMSPTGSHYYNDLDGSIVDLTVEQFQGEMPDYEHGEERTREYLLGNNDTKSRYLLLKDNLDKNINRKEVFRTELNNFKDEDVRKSTEIVLDMLPLYFYSVPASSSGKYNPAFSLGEGGLVRHVKVAMRILEEMYRDTAFGEYDDHTKDLIRMALILHDGFKSGLTNTGHTCREHPVIMSDFLIQNRDKLLISTEDTAFVSRLVRSHMGPWNTDKNGKVIMPVPKTREELLVHLCDYMASRNFLNVYFKDNEISDSAERDKVKSIGEKN